MHRSLFRALVFVGCLVVCVFVLSLAHVSVQAWPAVLAAAPADLVAPPTSLQGGPIGWARNFSLGQLWYLFPDGRLFLSRDGVLEAYLDLPGSSIRRIAVGENGLLAATDSGIFLRPVDESPWQLVSECAFSLVSITMGSGEKPRCMSTMSPYKRASNV